jgi:acyl-CoA dehydrogenase
MTAILRRLLAGPLEVIPVADVSAWRLRHAQVSAPFHTPVERALAGGFFADRLGYAFISGYGEALRQLFGDGNTPLDEAAALCATEEGGAHPKALKTQLVPDGDGFRLTGDKHFVTFGPLARVLFVVASEGAGSGRNRLTVVRIPANRDGVQVTPLPELSFVPEIPHASVRFTAARVEASERLPGDGYEAYLKPFRTVEDCHVMAAFLGWLVQLGRRFAFPQPILQELALLVAAVTTLAAAPPLEPALHVALGGFLERLDQLVSACEPHLAAIDPETRARWERDRSLLRVAGRVRAQRLSAAWQRLAEAQAATAERAAE